MLAKMLGHVLAGGGKRMRPAIALLAGKFGDYNADLHVPLAASIELLHTATLVHDDVIDASPSRRGRDTANALFNNAASVMLGDFMFAHSAELIARTDDTQVVRLFAHTIMAIAGGELHQDMSAYDYGQDTLNYFGRIEGKTASLFATSAEGGAMVARCTPTEREALRDVGLNVGMAFQVVDDILDFAGDEEEMGKPIGSDLMQGTLTLPSLLLMDRYPKDNPIKKAFRRRSRSPSTSPKPSTWSQLGHPQRVLRCRPRLPRARPHIAAHAARERCAIVAGGHRRLDTRPPRVTKV